MRWALGTIATAAVLAAGCGDGLGSPDPDGGFRPTPAIEDLDLGRVTAAPAADYVELRLRGFGEQHELLSAAGTMCGDAPDAAACEAAVAEASADFGFGLLCPPGDCYYYLVATRGGTVEVVQSTNELIEFLAPIDTAEEALLRLAAGSYRWSSTDLDQGAVRETEEGVEAYVTITSSYCAPLVEERRHVLVSPDGGIEVLGREEIFRDDDVCI